jgi:hypothetical protein
MIDLPHLIQASKNISMKKLIYIAALAAVFVACKGKTSELTTNKEMVSLSDSTFSNSSYLSDTGVVANPDEFINNGGIVSGKSTLPKKNNSNNNNNNSNSANNNVSSNNGSGTQPQSSGPTAASTTSKKKKGISKSAQGAIIGGVGGAVAGAVIGKNVKGAAIGSVIGAAGGYIIGRSKDKKDGRVGN